MTTEAKCAKVLKNGQTCGWTRAHFIHANVDWENYHHFEPPQETAGKCPKCGYAEDRCHNCGRDHKIHDPAGIPCFSFVEHPTLSAPQTQAEGPYKIVEESIPNGGSFTKLNLVYGPNGFRELVPSYPEAWIKMMNAGLSVAQATIEKLKNDLLVEEAYSDQVDDEISALEAEKLKLLELLEFAGKRMEKCCVISIIDGKHVQELCEVHQLLASLKA